MTVAYELNEYHFDRPMQFYEDMMNRMDNDPDLPCNLVFSDACTIQRNGNFN